MRLDAQRLDTVADAVGRLARRFDEHCAAKKADALVRRFDNYVRVRQDAERSIEQIKHELRILSDIVGRGGAKAKAYLPALKALQEELKKREARGDAEMETGFYVSMVRDGRVALLAGPFATHAEALAQVEPARKLASKLDPWSDFDAFGTVKRTPANKAGVLNERLGIQVRGDAGLGEKIDALPDVARKIGGAIRRAVRPRSGVDVPGEPKWSASKSRAGLLVASRPRGAPSGGKLTPVKPERLPKIKPQEDLGRLIDRIPEHRATWKGGQKQTPGFGPGTDWHRPHKYSGKQLGRMIEGKKP